MSQRTQQEIAAPEAASPKTNEAEAGTEQQKEKGRRAHRGANGKTERRFFTSKRITQYAVFIALALVMKLVGKALTLTPTFTVTFVYLPWLLAGATLGPIGGMIVGALSDVLGNFIFGTPFIPLTFVSNALYPLPVALLFCTKRGNNYVKFTVGALCSLVLCTLGIGSLALYTWYGYVNTLGFFQYLLTFRMPQVGVFAVNLAVLLLLIAPLTNIGLLPASVTQQKNRRKVRLFALTAAVFSALVAAALIVLGVSGTADGAVYAVVLTIYAALMCQAGLALTDKTDFASALLKSATVVLLYVALAVTLAVKGGEIQFVYLLLVVVAIIAVIVGVRLLARRTRSQGEKRK